MSRDLSTGRLGYVFQSAYRQWHAWPTLAQRHPGAPGIGRYRT